MAVCPQPDPPVLHRCTEPDVTWGNDRGCPLVVHCWADLQLVHGFALLWQHKVNAKCQRVHACTRSVPGFDLRWIQNILGAGLHQPCFSREPIVHSE